jgi:hypothetical protein
MRPDLRFNYPAMHLEATSISDFLAYFEQIHLKIIREPRFVPTCKNVTFKHPDGLIAEYMLSIILPK